MIQIPESVQNHINEPMIIPMNPNLNIVNQTNIPQMIPNQQNLPLNSTIQMGLSSQLQNNPQNEDTSKILFLNFKYNLLI